MSGFFDRIARQAAGPAQVRLRSSLQLPFADVPTETATARHPDPWRPENAPLGQADAPQDPNLGRQDISPDGHGSKSPDQATMPREPISQAEPKQAIAPDPAGRRVPNAVPDTPPLPGAMDQTASPDAQRAPAIVSHGNPFSAQPKPEPANSAFPADVSEPPEGPPTGDFPALLVPKSAGAAAEALGAQSDTSSMLTPTHALQAHQPRRPAQDPEVHVHIGRVEVTSVAEPAPVQPPRPARRAPQLTLEAHLAKRGGVSS